MTHLTLLKVGGSELQEGPILARLVEILVSLSEQRDLVIVHGGGSDIAQVQEQLGIEPQFVEGLRVTDEASLRAAEMALSGLVNKRLTARLVNEGIRAIGLSGVDAGLFRAVKLRHPIGDLGRVGEISEVDASVVRDLLDKGFLPVVSPISLGQDGRPFNVNADHAALALAAALAVQEAIFLTNVPGVLVDGQLLEQLDEQQVDQLVDKGIVSGGMIPKVRSAVQALKQGVGSVRITDLAGLASGSGTRLELV